MSVLVTGASGFIGRRFMQPDFVALVRKPTGFNNEVIGDLTQLDSLEKICIGVDTIFHCAGNSNSMSSNKYDNGANVNLIGTRNLMEVAAKSGVKKFIFLSSVKAMSSSKFYSVNEDCSGWPTTAYGISKREAENIVLEIGGKFGMHVVNLRLAMVYGYGGGVNLKKISRMLRIGCHPVFPENLAYRSLVHVSDVISAMHLVASSANAAGKTYIVADSRTYSVREIFDEISKVSSLPLINLNFPANILRSIGELGNFINKICGSKNIINTEVISRLFESECYSPSLIEKELGWRAQVRLRDGLREMFR